MNKLKIKSIDLSNQHTMFPRNTKIIASIHLVNNLNKHKFAWYLYMNGKIKLKVPYSENNMSYEFNLKDPGEYNIKGYVKDVDGNRSSAYAETLKVYPQRKFVEKN